jgi:tetratricopeptide (TPR) repeat protein
VTAAVLALAACAAFAAKTDAPAAAAGGSSVLAVSSQTYSPEEAQRMLQKGHGIRDTRRVNIGAKDPDAPGAPPATPSGGGAGPGAAPQGSGPNKAASGFAGAAPGGPMTSAPAGQLKPGDPGYSQFPTGDLNVESGKAMLGGTPKDLRSDAYKAAASLQNADNQWRMGNFKGVVQETSRALLADPGNLQALAVQSDAYMKLRDFKGAEEAMLKAVAISTEDASLWGRLAWAKLKQGDAEGALVVLSTGLPLNPQDPMSYAMQAYALDLLGRKAEALAAIQQAAQLDPGYNDKLELAKAGQQMWSPEQEMKTDARARKKTGGMPPWLPWVAGPAIVGVGLVLMLSRGGSAEPDVPPDQSPPPES